MGSAVGKPAGLLLALGVPRSALCRAGGLRAPFQPPGASPGRAGRVIPAWGKRQICLDPAAPALPCWEEVARAFVPGSSQRLGQHLLTRCAPGGGKGGDSGAWAPSLPDSDLPGWSRKRSEDPWGKMPRTPSPAAFHLATPAAPGGFGTRPWAPRSHWRLSLGVPAGTTGAHGDGNGAGPAGRGTKLKACRDRRSLVVPWECSGAWHAQLMH